VSRIRAGHSEAAHKRRFVARVRCSQRIGDNAVSATPSLHHEVPIPCFLFRESQREADAKLLAVYAFAPLITPSTRQCAGRAPL
jgi:hypothetical protein